MSRHPWTLFQIQCVEDLMPSPLRGFAFLKAYVDKSDDRKRSGNGLAARVEAVGRTYGVDCKDLARSLRRLGRFLLTNVPPTLREEPILEPRPAAKRKGKGPAALLDWIPARVVATMLGVHHCWVGQHAEFLGVPILRVTRGRRAEFLYQRAAVADLAKDPARARQRASLRKRGHDPDTGAEPPAAPGYPVHAGARFYQALLTVDPAFAAQISRSKLDPRKDETQIELVLTTWRAILTATVEASR